MKKVNLLIIILYLNNLIFSIANLFFVKEKWQAKVSQAELSLGRQFIENHALTSKFLKLFHH
jgi:hypothetical protein